MGGCFPPSPATVVEFLQTEGSPCSLCRVSCISLTGRPWLLFGPLILQMASHVDLTGFYSLQVSPSTLSAFPFSSGIKKMTLNCLQNKTAALSLELDKKASETGTKMKKWKVGEGRGASKLTIKSHWVVNTSFKLPLQMVLGTQGKESRSIPEEDRPRFTSQGLHLKTWHRNTDSGTFAPTGCEGISTGQPSLLE